MNNIIKPVPSNRESLELILKGENKLTICSPFYTAGGLMLLDELLSLNNTINEIDFSCRLTTSDWIQGGIDPEHLLRLIQKYQTRIIFNIASADNLHAKAYYGAKNGLVGSANLSSQGFGNSLEFLLLLSGEVLVATKKWFKKRITPSLKLISIQQLENFVSINKDAVNKKRQIIAKSLQKKRSVSGLPFPSIDIFIDFCAKRNDSVSKEVVMRFMGKDQLSGHIRNFYYASQQFLYHNNTLLGKIATVPLNNFRLQKASFKNKWIHFIRSPELKDIGVARFFRASTINYLPKSLGGKQTTGGAGVGNLNRVLPLVAHFRMQIP